MKGAWFRVGMTKETRKVAMVSARRDARAARPDPITGPPTP